MSTKTLLPILALCLLIAGLACDSASPVAPSGTVLAISATPNEIGVNGTSTVRVTALRANGTPVNPGTIIRLDTTVGTIQSQVETDDQGVAEAILRGDGRIGTATVTARSGSAESVSIEVQVGKTASSISLQATPTSLPETGGRIDLLALVRDDQGQPLPNATVNFTADVGTLGSRGGFVTTGLDGTARDSLTVSETEISTLAADQFNVGAEVGGGQASFTVDIQRPPDADFNPIVTTNSRFVVFEDRSTNNPTRWFWTFREGDDDPSPETSTVQNPNFTFGSNGDKFVTLEVSNAIGSDSITKVVTINAGSQQ